jgi:hypothetical protein
MTERTIPQGPLRSRWIAVVGALVALLAILIPLDDLETVRRARHTLHSVSGGAASPGARLVKIHRQLGLEPPTGSVLPATPEEMVSTIVIVEDNHRIGWPLLSIVVDEDDLHDPESGIAVNPLGRGRDWERIAYVSYFEDRELVFATRAGIRMHGGVTRHVPGRTSYRLHFRDVYGSDPRRPSILFGRHGPAAANLIVRDPSMRLRWANAYGLEIGRRVGAVVPRTKPAILYLNGEAEGRYLLTEHMHPDGWGASWFGHRDFSYVGFRGDRSERSLKAYEELIDWANRSRGPLSLQEAAERIDIENFTAHLFTQIYCSNVDWVQGAAVQDESRSGTRWFWVLWDLDGCYLPGRPMPRPVWQTPGLDTVLNPRKNAGDVRTLLLHRLLQSPDYRAHYVRRVMDWLNHRLNPAFFNALRDYSMFLGARPARPEAAWRQFAERRADRLRRELEERLETGPVHEVTIDIPRRLDVLVDGYSERHEYRGWYFDGEMLEIRLSDRARRPVTRWTVNGELVEGESIRIPVRESLRIVPARRDPSEPAAE